MPTGNARGFTFIEIMVVVMILGIMTTLAFPRIQNATVQARESVLKKDLFTLRDLIDQYYADHAQYPPDLRTLKEDGYLRAVPLDPFTESSETWVTVSAEGGGVFDVHSGSDLVGLNGIPYNQW